MTQTDDNSKSPDQKRHATYKDILLSESKVQEQTYKTYGKWFVRLGQAIDVLLELRYYKCSLPEDQNSDEYRFVLFALDTYYEAPLSFRSCSALMEKGLYHDSLNCCRSILESLVKYKYLLDHKELIIAYETDGKDSSGQKVTIKRAWEYVAGKDSQKTTYHFLSKFEHKNFGSSLPRLNASMSSASTFSLLPTFNKTLAEVVINKILFLIFGYINLAERFFPYEKPIVQADFFDNYSDIKSFLHQQIQKKKIDFPQSTAWCEIMQKIIY
ncbi:MAG: hypothetical protein HY860_05185 [Chlamydiales bacterium]|nr:hypothetical protein [Chlamydiales bacterium]